MCWWTVELTKVTQRVFFCVYTDLQRCNLRKVPCSTQQFLSGLEKNTSCPVELDFVFTQQSIMNVYLRSIKAFDDNYFICAFHLETSICGVCTACSLLFTGSTVHSGQFDRMILSKHVQNCILGCITYLWNLISLQACSMWSLDHSLHGQHGISYIYVSIAAVNEMKR